MSSVSSIISLLGLTLLSLMGLTVLVLGAESMRRGFLHVRRTRVTQPVPFDLRHASAALVFPAATASGLLAAGAPAGWCLVAALLASPGGLAIAMMVPPWEDERHRPWAGGAMLLVPTMLILTGAWLVRGA